MTLVVRGVLDLRLRLGLVSTLLHPVWVACFTWIFGRSTFINGVLHRNAKAFQTQITCKEVFD